MMNIAVIGLGSMGRRRIRCLRTVLGEKVHILGVDLNEKRQKEVVEEYHIETCGNLDLLLQTGQIDAAFISTAPLAHAGLIRKCLAEGVNVFTEINLVADGYKENMQLARENGLVLFLSSTMLYRKETGYVAGRVADLHRTVNYSYHVGQYLPDWHPWDLLNEFFISKKETNGCRELFAIELPWLIDAFGEISGFTVKKSRISELPINYMDNYLLLVEHTNGNKGVIAVDVISREAVRELCVWSEEIFLKWDGTPSGLYRKDFASGKMQNIDCYESCKMEHRDGYSSNIIENAYVDEIKNFLAVIEGKEQPLWSFEDDKKVLSLIDRIEAE